jgi:hypothetical protein
MLSTQTISTAKYDYLTLSKREEWEVWLLSRQVWWLSYRGVVAQYGGMVTQSREV